MKILKFSVILGCLVSNIAPLSATEIIEIKLGRDWYYHNCYDSYIFIDAPRREDVVVKPYDCAPKVPDGFKSRTECVLSGFPFKPSEFWKQPMAAKLTILKNAIWKCGELLHVIDEHYDAQYLYRVRYSKQPAGEPYPAKLEAQFEKAVWEILHEQYGISLDDFTTSLRSMLISEDTLYSAPLIVYFSDKLAPRYEFRYKGINEWDRVLMKVIKHPSEFEVLTGTPDVGTVVYERKVP